MKKLNRLSEYLLAIAIILLLLSGFSITINSYHWEFKGLIRIVYKLIFGVDL